MEAHAEPAFAGRQAHRFSQKNAELKTKNLALI